MVSTDPVPDAPDPVRQLLRTSPDPTRALGAAQWAGIGGLAGAILVAAVAIPPLINLGDDGGPASLPPGFSPPGTVSVSASAAPPTSSASPLPSRTAIPDASPPPTGARGAETGAAPRTTPPAPSATAEKFTPVTVQAEDPRNQLTDGAATTTCTTCDGGARVRYIGALTIYADLPTAGNRTITVTYECDGNRGIQITTDNRTWTFTVNGTSWETPKTLTFNAYLPAGRNALLFENDNHPAPDIDKLTIS